MSILSRGLRVPPVRRHRLSFLCVSMVMVFTFTCTCTAQSLDPIAIENLYVEGNAFFRKANDATAVDREQSYDLYQKAALRFERIAHEGNVANGKLFYNIGNCYFRMNDLGRAILNYRRAQRYIPNDQNLLQNLDYARARRQDRVETRQRTRVLKTLFFWHYDLSTRARTFVFTIVFVTGWVLAALRLFFRRGALQWGLLSAFVVASCFFASLLIQELSWLRTHSGVVLNKEVVARKGDSETYEPSFQEPLHPGTEFTLIEKRNDWYHVELVDGRQCWVPVTGVELVY